MTDSREPKETNDAHGADDGHTVGAEIDEVFRRESGRLIPLLTRILGPHNLELAEDVVQEAFVAALGDWQRNGIPDNPAAWLLTTARNRAIDAIRRERTRRTFADEFATFLDSSWTMRMTVDEQLDERFIRDDQLRMIFMCCSADITPENRMTLILRTLCGLSVPAIARAMLSTVETINKRLYRTRQSLRGATFALPEPEALPAALDTVHTALYLLFNEGHLSTGDEPVVRELCRDAMLLTQMLVEEPTLSTSDTVALLAVMCFHAARLDARVDDAGRLVTLDQQDRSLWDQALIREGFRYLQRSSTMEAVTASRWHLEAAIAARHCQAKTFPDTDWQSICNLYDRMVEVVGGAGAAPMVELNRAVAVSFRDGPAAAIPLVESIRAAGQLPHSHSVASVLANLWRRAGDEATADAFLREALEQTTNAHQREFLERQLRGNG